MNVVKRVKSPTPKFFRKLRNIGIGIAAVGTALTTVPVALPVWIVTIGGYLIVAGTVASTVAQTVVADRN